MRLPNGGHCLFRSVDKGSPDEGRARCQHRGGRGKAWKDGSCFQGWLSRAQAMHGGVAESGSLLIDQQDVVADVSVGNANLLIGSQISRGHERHATVGCVRHHARVASLASRVVAQINERQERVT